MSVDAAGHIGPIDTGPVNPVHPVRKVGSGKTIMVRPVTGTTPIHQPQAPHRTHATRSVSEPRSHQGTAFQTNADGDAAVLGSRLGSLSEAEQAELAKLKERDAEVRTHEQAHIAAAGGLARGGAQYDYQTGPDGTQYAVGGHVQVDTSPGSTPEETIAKAQQIKRAALAPANPSGQDRAVAAKAMRMESEARRELIGAQHGATSSTGTVNAASAGAGGPGAAGRTLDLIA